MSNNIDYEEKIAFSQAYDVIMFMDENDRNRIPSKFIEFLKINKDENYISTINPYLPLEFQKIGNQARAIISYIYVKYLADEEEKAEFRAKEKIEYENYRKEIEERSKNMFDNPKKVFEPVNIEENNNLALIEKKESFFEKIKNKILSFFGKGK